MIPLGEDAMKSVNAYGSEVRVLLKSYLLTSPLAPYTSIVGGIVASKVVYDLTQLLSAFYIKPYSGLTKIHRLEWNNRGMSSMHAVFITFLSFYYIFFSNVFSDDQNDTVVTLQSSLLSIFGLGVSVGYFLADMGLILWHYPSLGGMEYVIHHSLSAFSIMYTMLSGEGQVYCYMCLISESTTPAINMRWYLDMSGLKRSTAYLLNGVVIFVMWLVARIMLFVYIFSHIYEHYGQVSEMTAVGRSIVIVVPFVLFVMNLVWFAKILKGLKKTLAKRL